MNGHLKIYLYFFLFFTVLTAGCRDHSPNETKTLPRLILWAWDRPEDLRSLLVSDTGVAYLSQTLIFEGTTFTRRPRLHPLRVNKGTPLIAVTRIEVDENRVFSPSSQLVDYAAATVLNSVEPGVLGLQIDFDARSSERLFYRDLLEKLRNLMPPSFFLSITSLTSWALHDGWIQDLPVDEAVPMCFEMGAGARLIRFRMSHYQDFIVPIARRAIGLSLNEPLAWIPPGRRIYVFNHRRWNPATIDQAIREFKP